MVLRDFSWGTYNYAYSSIIRHIKIHFHDHFYRSCTSDKLIRHIVIILLLLVSGFVKGDFTFYVDKGEGGGVFSSVYASTKASLNNSPRKGARVKKILST